MLVVQQLMSALLAPLPITLVLLLAAFVLLLAGWRRAGLGGMALALAWLWVWSLPVVADQIGAGLESRYPPLAADSPQLPQVDAIVVAGGVFGAGLAHPHPNLNAAADRYWHAARLFHAGKAPWIIVSGGGRPGSSRPTEAASARLFLLDLGVPDGRILLEDQARTTRGNAVRVQAMAREHGFDKLLLVTSALHMRRTEASFRALGMDIVPGLDMSGTGKTGVWLFFVLSSFLLMHQFLHLDARGRLGPREWWRYAWRRVLHIYPLYTVFLLACWLLPLQHQMPPMSAQEVLDHLTVRRAFWLTWSIAVELKYYLVLPLMVLLYIHVARRSFWAATVLCALAVGIREWLDPPFTPGHWVPEMIEMAGGENLSGVAGSHSTQTDWDALHGLDPDVLIIMPCGYGLNASSRDADAARERLLEVAPRAIADRRAYVVDGSAYFNRSGPRFISGIEILAGILHPGRFAPPPADTAATWT